MSTAILAANWKMHHGPAEAKAFLDSFLSTYAATSEREVWFFPSAVSLPAVVGAIAGHDGILAGAQHVHWEPAGAFTGELSVSIASEAGARAALVGHSERRHIFGETDDETGRKVRALLDGGLTPVLCVGETLEERESDSTLNVVDRQLSALDGLDGDAIGSIVIAYEPVWAIGTGRTATPADASVVHASIRNRLVDRGAATTRILYGGSVKPGNASDLLNEPEIDGVLVGGASLDPTSWSNICRAAVD